jgi:hypothetical protein
MTPTRPQVRGTVVLLGLILVIVLWRLWPIL